MCTCSFKCIWLWLLLRLVRTGRPVFTGTDRATTEDFFLESLNAWRAKQGLDKFILVGHSLGELRWGLPVMHIHVYLGIQVEKAGKTEDGKTASQQQTVLRSESAKSKVA